MNMLLSCVYKSTFQENNLMSKVLGTLNMPGGEYIPVTPIFGKCNERFSAVRTAFARNLDSGQDIGASFAICLDGELVVDLWGGYFDTTFSRLWERDTIVQLYSSTKTMLGLVALILADRGELDLNAPVAKYWPDFAAEGKGEIAVRQLLGHTSGLCGWADLMTLQDMYDWEKSTTLLARQAPFWKPGRVAGYHGNNQGHLVGEVVRRITGKLLGQFLADEVSAPLGVGADYYISVPAEADRRVSPLIQGQPNDVTNGDPYVNRALYNPHVTPQDTWTIAWRRAELGALNGHGNARGIATLQSILACGEANGVRLMSEAGRERVLEQQSDGVDLVMGLPCRWGMAYSLESAVFWGVPSTARIAWWGGNGGSMSFVDLDARMSIGFAQNRWMGGGPYNLDRSRHLIQAAYASLAQ
jgi:CubicO group peptidase (beta-lactamase class C family)